MGTGLHVASGALRYVPFANGVLALAEVQGNGATAGGGKNEVEDEEMQAVAELNGEKPRQKNGNGGKHADGRRQRSRSPKDQK